MAVPKPDIARERIREKLKSPSFPRTLPNPPMGQLETRETISIGGGAGKPCNGCDETIEAREADLAQLYDYGVGGVYRFHDSCWKIWNDERQRPRPRSSSEPSR